MKEQKAVIETIINSAAIVLSATGTTFLLNKDYFGFALIVFAVLLEFTKYLGRSRKLW
tara:strand:+ start:437 stop:610 length:174 start_codon:yes stop_codon:yes gene_type:complete